MTFLVRYQLAVTRRKEEESQSSSIYYQNDIWTPTIAFADFINNETLLGEVGRWRDRGEGLFCVWCLGCPHLALDWRDGGVFPVKGFSDDQHGSSLLG